MNIYGDLWTSMKFYEHLWQFLKIDYQTPMFFYALVENAWKHNEHVAFLLKNCPSQPSQPSQAKPAKSAKQAKPAKQAKQAKPSLETYDNQWTSMKIYENLWKSMNIYEILWTSMNIYDNIWTSNTIRLIEYVYSNTSNTTHLIKHA